MSRTDDSRATGGVAGSRRYTEKKTSHDGRRRAGRCAARCFDGEPAASWRTLSISSGPAALSRL
eukprot:scaffold7047_cov136-Isochrysis_galbana.AAC.2